MIEIPPAGGSSDPRFEYFHLDVRNELYNPDGPPWVPTRISVSDHACSKAQLARRFSVFTHLNAADDFRSMFGLRRYVREDVLFFTVFLNERSATEYGGTDAVGDRGRDSRRDGFRPMSSRRMQRSSADVAKFLDLDPEHPLRVAMYSRDYAFELLDGTGWKVERVVPDPERVRPAPVRLQRPV